MIKYYYKDKVRKISEKINEYDKCFNFSIVADTHLDNSLDDTYANIKAVDENVGFEFLLHLGDF